MKWNWYTNGVDNVRVYENESVPEGFTKGMSLKPDVLERKQKVKDAKNRDLATLKNMKQGMSRKQRALINEQTNNTRSFNKFKKRMDSLLKKETKIVMRALKEGKTPEEISELCKDVMTPGFEKRLKVRILAYQLLETPQYLETILCQLKEFQEK